MTHRHIFGSKGRGPQRGDLCLACPCRWEDRGRGECYTTDAYRPRTRAHQIHRKNEEAA